MDQQNLIAPQPPPPPADLSDLGVSPALFPPGPFTLSQDVPPPPPGLSKEQLAQRLTQIQAARQVWNAASAPPQPQGRGRDAFAPLHHKDLQGPKPGGHPFDQVATDVANYIEHMSDQLAGMMREGGRAPFSVQLSRQQQDEYYVHTYGDLVYNADGSPNEHGRDALEKAFGPDGFAEIVRVVLQARRHQMAAANDPLLSYPLYEDVGTPLPGAAPMPPPPPAPPRPQALQPPTGPAPPPGMAA